MKRYLSKIAALLFVVFFLLSQAPTAQAAARDCDTNAIIYCGTLTKEELYNKLAGGTGKAYQSGPELQALFARFGADVTDIENLVVGRVTSGNNVYVGDQLVASDVFTFGRHNIAGSSLVPDLPYTLYRRHPSVSFLSGSIEAYVLMNYDGTMAYAILKSCGNIVEGVGKRTRPTPPPPPSPVRVPLTILKFNDANNNGTRELTENYLPGWDFRVSGENVQLTVTTDTNGRVIIPDLNQGYYVITEIQKDGWENTTGVTVNQLVTDDTDTQTVLFGNYQVTTPPTPGGGETPTTLPVSGLKENIAIAVSLILALSLLAYVSTRFYLKRVLHGKSVPTNPAKLIKELQKRSDKRYKKVLKAEAKAEKKLKNN